MLGTQYHKATLTLIYRRNISRHQQKHYICLRTSTFFHQQFLWSTSFSIFWTLLHICIIPSDREIGIHKDAGTRDSTSLLKFISKLPGLVKYDLETLFEENTFESHNLRTARLFEQTGDKGQPINTFITRTDEQEYPLDPSSSWDLNSPNIHGLVHTPNKSDYQVHNLILLILCLDSPSTSEFSMAGTFGENTKNQEKSLEKINKNETPYVSNQNFL